MALASPPNRTLTLDHPELTISRFVRQVRVQLPSHSTSGYSWYFLALPQENGGVHVVSRGVDTSACPPGVVGCSGTALYDVLLGAQPSGAEVTLAFVSLRPFDIEGTWADAEKVVFKVHVQ